MTNVLLTPALIDGEFRILDTDLAKRLGFERPRTIRTLITRWKDELERLGICCAVQQNHEGGRGRPAMAYYLNRKQAIFITAKSETPEATDITIEIIHRFDEYEVGRLCNRDVTSNQNRGTHPEGGLLPILGSNGALFQTFALLDREDGGRRRDTVRGEGYDVRSHDRLLFRRDWLGSALGIAVPAPICV
jgi:hypothetical protein